MDMMEPTEPVNSSEQDGAAAEGGVEEQVRTALRTVTDPELGINIVDLGLVYDVEVEDGAAQVTMTLTSPGCPAGGQILGGAKDAAESVDGVEEAVVSLVWKPFWTPEKIDPQVRAMLGF
ncbi:metal-sulfur cluster assembly factor [Candidatus Palauibacter sp.]|uniref:metal-sulfur cluster assembly factor n=1 Tax=Candidatus Palauibacter sp. TaxID=3101350 RepID=UPI003B5A7A5C